MILRITMEDKREVGETIENQFNCGSIHVFELTDIDQDDSMADTWNQIESFLRDKVGMTCKSMECHEHNAHDDKFRCERTN